jgi:sirohydrochlorin cobaltochelatase
MSNTPDALLALGVNAKILRAAKALVESGEAEFGPVYDRKDALLLVVSRGFAESKANAIACKFTRMLGEGMGFGWALTGYCETAYPSSGEALDHGVRLGFQRVVVFPYCLFDDSLVGTVRATADAYRREHPTIQLIKTPRLDDHPLVSEALARHRRGIDPEAGNMNCQHCRYRGRVVHDHSHTHHG